MMPSRTLAALLAASCLLAACAQPPRTNTASTCPESASEMPAQWLYGYWIARVDGQEPVPVRRVR